jgi:hypothetical protein
MVLIAYFLGQKHYPIPYPILRMLSYMITVVVIYLVYTWGIQPYLTPNTLLSYLVSTLLVLSYLVGIYVVDGSRIKAMLQQVPSE